MLEYKEDSIYFIDCDEEAHSLPSKFVTCHRCNGKGTTYLGHYESYAFTASDRHELGPDFMQDYMDGVYDRPCPSCKGKGKELSVDYTWLKKGDKGLYDAVKAWEEEEAYFQSVCEAERRFGC